jgi:hypothetical protein
MEVTVCNRDVLDDVTFLGARVYGYIWRNPLLLIFKIWLQQFCVSGFLDQLIEPIF